jgi:hypothetical protein
VRKAGDRETVAHGGGAGRHGGRENVAPMWRGDGVVRCLDVDNGEPGYAAMQNKGCRDAAMQHNSEAGFLRRSGSFCGAARFHGGRGARYSRILSSCLGHIGQIMSLGKIYIGFRHERHSYYRAICT